MCNGKTFYFCYSRVAEMLFLPKAEKKIEKQYKKCFRHVRDSWWWRILRATWQHVDALIATGERLRLNVSSNYTIIGTIDNYRAIEAVEFLFAACNFVTWAKCRMENEDLEGRKWPRNYWCCSSDNFVLRRTYSLTRALHIHMGFA